MIVAVIAHLWLKQLITALDTVLELRVHFSGQAAERRTLFISNNTVFDLMKRANLLKAGLEKWTLSANTKVSHTALNYFTKRNPDIEKVDMFWVIKKYQKKRFSKRHLSVPILIVTNKWKLIVWVNNKEKAHRFRCEKSLSDSNALLAPMYHNLDCPAVLDSKVTQLTLSILWLLFSFYKTKWNSHTFSLKYYIDFLLGWSVKHFKWLRLRLINFCKA